MLISDLRKRYNRLDEIALSRIDPAYWYGVQVRSSGNYRRPIARHHPSAHALSTLPHLHVKLAASRRRTHPLIARVRGANMLRLAIAMEQRRVTGIVLEIENQAVRQVEIILAALLGRGVMSEFGNLNPSNCSPVSGRPLIRR